MKIQELQKQIADSPVVTRDRALSLEGVLLKAYARILSLASYIFVEYEDMRFSTKVTDLGLWEVYTPLAEILLHCMTMASVIGIQLEDVEYNEGIDAKVPWGNHVAKLMKYSADPFYMLNDVSSYAVSMSVENIRILNRITQTMLDKLGCEITYDPIKSILVYNKVKQPKVKEDDSDRTIPGEPIEDSTEGNTEESN